ncbi:MAG: acyltransferase family protein, partial [Pseudomonadota bacterium]
VFALIVCIGTGMVILAGMHPNTRCNALLESTPFVAVGKWSYSLYLVHWPIIVFATYAFAPFEQLSVKLLLLAASVAGAFLLYRFVEMPFRTAGTSDALQANAPRKPIVAAAVGIGAICAGAFAIKEADGFPARLPAELRQMVDRTGNLHDRRDCHFVTVARLRTDDLCRRGADATAPSFVLLGDSHADALSPAVFAAAEQIGVNGIQITGNGFRPLVGVRKRGQDAADLVTPLIDYLRARPELKTILIALFWEHQLTGRTYRHTGDVWLDAKYDGTGTAYNPIATRRGLEKFMAALPERTFVFLGDVPTGASFDPTQAARHLFYSRDPGVAVSGISVKAYMDRSRTERQFLAMISRNPDLTGDARRHYEPIAQGICGSKRCPAFDGRVPIYRDGDHLSRSGAQRMIAPLREILSRHTAPAP